MSGSGPAAGALAGWLADLLPHVPVRVVLMAVGGVVLAAVAVVVNPDGRDRW